MTNNDTLQAVREAFEKRFTGHYHLIKSSVDGGYCNPLARTLWEGFIAGYQAALLTTPQAAQEEVVKRVRTYAGGFGYEISGGTMYIGPMRKDGRKVADIVCTIDWDDTYTDESKVRRLVNAERICVALATLTPPSQPAAPKQEG